MAGGELSTRERAPLVDIDLAGLVRALWARRLWILIPSLVALLGAFGMVSITPATYRSETRLLVENGDSPYTRPEADRAGSDRGAVDQEAVLSQVQLVLSRDVAKIVAERLELSGKAEFDPVLRGFNPIKHVFIALGLVDNPLRMTAEERVLRSYFEKLSAFQVDKSRIVAVQFESQDPLLAARAADTVAAAVIEAQQAAKRSQTRNASQWLSGEVDGLRRKVEEAEGRVESFRARANLFVGSNNTSLTAQQLAEINSQIATASAQQSDAQTRARLLRDFLRTGRAIESGDILNSEIIRRITEQRASVLAQLAEQSSTLGPRHPRIAELQAQRASLDGQLRTEAEKLVRVLENDARFAGARVEALRQSLDQVKRQASQASEQEVQLRALEREAKALRDQLETLLARYRDASARDTLSALPADARVISRALVSNIPAYPKKLPTILIVTLGTLVLAAAIVATLALLEGEGRARAVADEPGATTEDDDAEPRDDLAAVLPMHATKTDPVARPEIIEDLMRHLDHAPEPGTSRRILITAVEDGIASSGVALSLARELAATGRRTLLVDRDAEEPLLSVLAGPLAPGLSDLAAGQAGFADILHGDPQSAAHVLPCGTLGDAGTELAGHVVEVLSHAYDDVVIAAGRIPASPEAFDALCDLGDEAVLVTEMERLDATVEAAQGRLAGAGLKPLLLILAPEEEAVRLAA